MPTSLPDNPECAPGQRAFTEYEGEVIVPPEAMLEEPAESETWLLEDASPMDEAPVADEPVWPDALVGQLALGRVSDDLERWPALRTLA